MRSLVVLGALVSLLFPAHLFAATPVHVGVAISRTQATSATALATSLDAVQDTQAPFVRIHADWTKIQPHANTWNFSSIDNAMKAVEARKLKPILVLGPSPRWAVTYLGPNPSATEVSRAKPDLTAYASFASALAKRYQSRVAYYQLWDRPTCHTMLAMPRDVHAVYREGAKAIHAVSPALRVMVVESQNVDISWIMDYFIAAQGVARADAIVLAPQPGSLTPLAFAHRIQVLRGRVMPRTKQPELWTDVVVDSDEPHHGLALASTALLQGVSNIIVSPSNSDAIDNAAWLTALQGTEYQGWSKLAPEVMGGLFSGKGTNRVLALPMENATLHFVLSRERLPWGLVTPNGEVHVSRPGKDRQTIDVNGPTPLKTVTGQPLLISGVDIEATSGVFSAAPKPITASSISLDLSGENPLAIRPLRHLPGGTYFPATLHGHQVLSTIRDTAPWIHFEIPDGLIFYNTARVPVEVTIEVLGAVNKKKAGFNLYYDAVGGMRYTNWTWIDVGPRQVFSYTFRLNDAIFAGREGYDFRLNMGGSDESIKVVGVTVRKLPKP